jgi:hypothetical protein
MTIINVAVLIVTAVLAMTLKKVVCRLHGRIFGIPEDRVAAMAYGYLGIYRLLVLVFNIVPYVSLVLIK